jgi:glutamate formiminotransferase
MACGSVRAVLECVVNVSEGRRQEILSALAGAAGTALLDVHGDPHHNRAVLTLAGPAVEDAARAVSRAAVELLDLRSHSGAHPRLGVVDVVPFVPLNEGADVGLRAAVEARDRFAAWAAQELALPCFLYGPERPLPEVRRRAFADLDPDTGPSRPHETAGAACVGARQVLVAYNLWLPEGVPLSEAKRVAAAVRGPAVRALGLQLGTRAQVSLNLLDPGVVGPAEAFDRLATLVPVERGELVGLCPAVAVKGLARSRRDQLGIEDDALLEVRLTEARKRW